MTYISSNSLLSPLRSSVQQAQTALAQVQNEISTGAPNDLGLTLGAGTGYLLSIRSQTDQFQAITTSNGIASTRLTATDNAIGTIATSAKSVLSSLITAQSSGTTSSALTTTVSSALSAFVSQLNTSVGNESIFGGINTAQSPIAAYGGSPPSAAKQAVDNSFTQQFGTTPTGAGAASISGTDMQSYLDSQFSTLFNDTGWQANWSSATNTTMSSTIAAGQTASTSISANETAFRQIAQAYAMVSEFSGSNLSSDAQQAVVATASKLMSAGIAGLTSLQTSVGQTQNDITAANTQMSSQSSVLQGNASSFDSVDTYELSTKLTQLQTQLESAYEMTSNLKSLSLTNYLVSG